MYVAWDEGFAHTLKAVLCLSCSTADVKMYAVAIGISSMLCQLYNTADVSSYCQAHFKVC